MIELPLVLNNERDEAESRMTGITSLEEGLIAVEEDLEQRRVVCARDDELIAECPSLTAGTEQKKAEGKAFAPHIPKIGVSAATCNGMLGAVMHTVQ